MNILKLKGKMVEKGVNVDWLAGATGLSRSTVYRKMESADFTVREAMIIKDALDLTRDEAHDIFLA